MSQNDTAYDSTVQGNNNSDSGQVYVPAEAQREEGICIDSTVAVTLTDIDADPFIDTVSFEGVQSAGDRVTVPAELMRRLGFEGGESVTAEFEAIEEDDEDDDSSELGGSQGAQAEEESDTSLGELFSTDDEVEEESEAEVEEEESEGLGELFG